MSAATLLLGGASYVVGAITGFVDNPNGNSSDWSAAVAALGGTVNTDLNFDTNPLGTLQPNFYLASDGVTLSGVNSLNSVTFGSGPGQANNFTPPVSSGEGLHPVSNYLIGLAVSSTLTISFNAPVLGAGLFVIDNFNPSSQQVRNPIAIEAFSGPGGSGVSLGLFHGAQYNFQPDHLYFMGIISGDANIRSLVFYQPGAAADVIGVDNIMFAPVPEPSVVTLAALGLIGIKGMRKLRR